MLILASGSPRRAEILNLVGWRFEKQVINIDESKIDGETSNEYVKRLALEKAEAVAKKNTDRLVLGADTIVVVDGDVTGKPIDLEDAARMLRKLSGKWHEVLTGVALVKNSKRYVSSESTRVKFSRMNDEEIEFLVRHGNPLDKAGAYAVQAQASLFIERIEGVYWNIVGLPINLVYHLIKKFTDDELEA